jgi:hypothetical protein
MFETKPDFEEAKKRHDAFWQCEIIDRALTTIQFCKPEEECVPWPPRPASARERTLDIEWRVEQAQAGARNTVYFADAMPVTVPAIGPSLTAAPFGCDLEFGEATSWATHPWEEGWPQDDGTLGRMDRDNPWLKISFELTDALREAGRGLYITGLQPWLSPGDVLSSLRSPEQFCMDLALRPDEVMTVSQRMHEDLLALYDLYYRKAREAGDYLSTWLPVVSEHKYHTIQNDVAALISPEMFDTFLLPFTKGEVAHLDRTVYHLDGLQALKDLDRLLEIPELDAVQWGPPPQHWDWHEWIDVYRRIQEAGKGFWLPIPAKDVHELKDTPLKPEGAWLMVEHCPDRDTAEKALRIIEAWR